jgi:hypothetical protein
MGNGMTERFNRTLLNILGTLESNQKKDWKSHVAVPCEMVGYDKDVLISAFGSLK